MAICVPGHALALDAILGLEVAEEVAEVDVEQVARLGEHHVVVVPVADAHDVRGDAVPSEGETERVDGLAVCLLHDRYMTVT